MIEIPAFMIVLTTVVWLMTSSALTLLIWTKIALGAVAVAFNVICVVLVFKRLQAARAGDFARWETLDHRQHGYGAVVLLGLLDALSLGSDLLAAA